MRDQNYNKFTRIVMLINMLCQGKLVVADAAREAGVSIRTIQRDLRTIEDANFPIYSDKPGEIKFQEGYSLNKVQVTNTEASMLVVMSDMAKALGGQFEKSFNTLSNKVLNPSGASAFFIKMPQGIKYKETAITKTIEEAISSRNMLTISYQKRAQEEQEYKVKPLKIINYEGFWYLMALKTNNAMRTFRIENILEAKEMKETFKKPKNIEKILEESPNIWFSETKKIKITIKVFPEVADCFRERKIFPLQKIKKENKDGSLILESNISKNQEAIHIIVQWLPYLKILTPNTLRQDLQEILEESINKI